MTPGSLDYLQPFLLIALRQGVPVMIEDLPYPGPLRSRNRPSPPCSCHPQIFVLGLNAVSLDHLLPLLAEEAGVPRRVSRLRHRFLPTSLDSVGAGDLDRQTQAPQEAHGPGVQMHHFEALHAL